MDELQISGKRFISSRRIARDNGYTSDYIGQLIRGGKVVGQKVGRAWYVDAISFESYLGEEGVSVHPAHTLAAEPVVAIKVPEEKIIEPVKIVEPVKIKEIPEPPAPVEEVAEEKIPEPVVVAEKKEESHYVPLHIVKAEVPAGLRYYSDDRPSLPQIREVHTEKSEPWVAYPTEETKGTSGDIVFTPHPSHRTRPLNVVGFATLGIAVFIVSAVISSFMSLDLSIEAGNTASAAYSLHW